MRPEEVLSWRQAQPFQPFRIITSDGTAYEVQHPRLLMIGLSSVIVGHPSEQVPFAYSSWDVVLMGHIVRLEPREEPGKAANPEAD